LSFFSIRAAQVVHVIPPIESSICRVATFRGCVAVAIALLLCGRGDQAQRERCELGGDIHHAPTNS
jgi:hypothetical protein